MRVNQIVAGLWLYIGDPAKAAVRLAENKRKAERDDATKELRKQARYVHEWVFDIFGREE